MDDLNKTKDKINDEMQTAIEKAWEALSGYKFWMFGYHAARWVNYNRLLPGPERHGNPFRDAVALARSKVDGGLQQASRPDTEKEAENR